MTTKIEESPFVVNGEVWRQEQHLKDIAKRAQDWHHKQQLDLLPDFSARLRYWLDNVDAYPSVVNYPDESDDQPAFVLTVDPKTGDDQAQIHKCHVDYFRAQFDEENRAVERFNWKYNEFGAKDTKIAFTVNLFDKLKADLELRLSSVTRKQDLLESEKRIITESIDAACLRSNGITPSLAIEVNELRYNLETNRSYDFTFPNKMYIDSKIPRLAKVWDIIHYEAYLKDRLVGPINDLQPPPTATYKTFADLFFNPADVSVCLDVLNKYEKGKGRDGLFKKFVLVAWIDYLEEIRKIHTNHYNSVSPVLASELGQTFARRTHYDSAKGYNSAKTYFTMHIPH